MTTLQGFEGPDERLASSVLSMEWERVHLTIMVAVWASREILEGFGARSQLEFELVDGGRVLRAPAVRRENGDYELRINVTAFLGRNAIPNGTWRVRAVVNERRGPFAEYDGRALSHFDEASRVFLYDVNRSVLAVAFGIAENADHLDFLMRSYQFTRPKVRSKRFRPWKRAKAKLLGHSSKVMYAKWIYRFVNRWVGLRPGRILFASDQRLALEGNLLRVHERLIERGLGKQFEMKYSFRLPKTTGWGTTIRILYLMATSEIILLDDYFGLLKSVQFDPRTKVIQLWHAGSGFKSVGYSRFGNPGSPKLWHPHRQYTYAITGSEHLVPVYAEAFGIEETAVIPTGLPRVDWFLDEERTASFKEQFYQDYPHLRGKRVLLFAPTFRGTSIYKAFYDYSLIDFDGLYRACGDDTVVLFRMHHFVKDTIPIPDEYSDRFFDFTKFPDGLGLLHVTDLLITDYSSIIYEFSLLDRPMLFFAPDEVNYAATRGFHRAYEDTAPGRVCSSFDEVIDALTTGEAEQWRVRKFRDENFDRIDTGSADRVIDWLILSTPSVVSTANRNGEDEDSDELEDVYHEESEEVNEEDIA